jgi:tetratricopeptide (TPR) repeat protein
VSANYIDLKTAAYQIRSAYDDRERTQPFFFIVGAGLSAPSVPLAREITEHCQAKVRSRETGVVQTVLPTGLDAYSYWFDRAYPQPADRQRYLRSLIENKPLSDASLRLAHILGSNRLTNLVVTPNFDDFISRALTIFGITHTVCDHPDTVDRFDLTNTEVKIVHVHGSYKFYDCRNLRDEVELRAQPSARTTRTMAAFLDRALSFSSPLVIGYSGWEDDVIMSALRRRIEGASLPYRLYWFVYRPEDAEELESRTPWLKNHPDVRLVVPKQTAPQLSSVDEEMPLAVAGTTESLPAQVILEEITRWFDLGEPEITKDPVGFFARQLRRTLMQETGQSSLAGIYSFEKVVARLDRAAQLEAIDFNSANLEGPSGTLEDVRRLVRQSQYTRAIELAESTIDQLGDEERQAIYELIDSLKENDLESEARLKSADLLIRIAEMTPDIATQPNFPRRNIQHLVQKGEALYRLERYGEAIAVFDGLVEMYGSSSDEKMKWFCLYALTRKALALGGSGRELEAAALYDKLLPSMDRNDWLAEQTRFNRACSLARANLRTEALAAFEEFVTEHRSAPNGWTQVLVASALERIAQFKEKDGDVPQAIAALHELLSLYRQTQNSQVATYVGGALLHLAEVCSKTDRTDEAMAALDDFENLATRFALPKNIKVRAGDLRQLMATRLLDQAQNGDD